MTRIPREIKRPLLLALALAAAIILFAAVAVKAEAVTGAKARSLARAENITLCGTTWWACRDYWAPAPACFGAGGGTWNCYGGVTEQHKAYFWKWRNCGTYIYVNRIGGTSARRQTCR